MPGKFVGVITGGAMGNDPFDPASWSGCSKALFEICRSRGILHQALGVRLAFIRKVAIALPRYHRKRDVWRRRLYMSRSYRDSLEKVLERRICARDNEYPIVQLGAYLNAARACRTGVPVFSYQDGNNHEFINSGFAPREIMTNKALIRECFEFEKEVALSMKLVFTTSNYLRSSFIDAYSVPEDRVVSIGFGVNWTIPDAAVLSNKDYNAKKLLFIGKEFIRKGGDVLCRAFRIVRKRFPAAEIHIVGPEGVPAEFSAEPGVMTHGFLNRHNVADRKKMEQLFRAATLLALPSRYEPFGLAPLEAMSYGIPAIVTDRWALAENVLPGQTGFHVGIGAVEQLAETIIEGWSDPSELAAMGLRAREFVLQRFTWDRVVDRLESYVCA